MWEMPVQRHQRLLGVRPSPILVAADGTILAEGRSGETHQQVFHRALADARTDRARMRLIDALSNDAQHKFGLNHRNGKPMIDETGVRIIVTRMEAGRIADAMRLRSRQYRGTPLEAQQIRRTCSKRTHPRHPRLGRTRHRGHVTKLLR